MATRRRTEQDPEPIRRRPAITPEGREDQLIALANDLAEQQMREGTASSQVISHFLKLGSSREKLEQLRISHEVELLKAKEEQMATIGRIEELYSKAIGAMRQYQGQEPVQEEYDYED